MKTQRRRNGGKPGASGYAVKLTIVALTCAPATVLFASFYHGGELFGHHPHNLPAGGTVDTPVSDRALEADLPQPNAAAGAAAAAALPGVTDPLLGKDSGSSSSWSLFSNNAQKAAASNNKPKKKNKKSSKEDDDELVPLERNDTNAWEAKRAIIGSEPMSGDWLLNCPAVPPPGYPQAYPIMDLIENWNPDKPTPVPQKHFHALCRFDYRK
jgi:hypothetical protein